MDFLNTLKNMFSGGDTAKVLSEMQALTPIPSERL